MSLANALSRLTAYSKRHGAPATVRRALLALKRTLFASRMMVFYCDLDRRSLPKANLPPAARVRKLTALGDLSPEYLHEIVDFWNPKLAHRNLQERFAKGAVLWLIEYEGRLAGYGWSLRGRTIEPYYFPLAQEDVHLFDFQIFPSFRGRGLNPRLVGAILDQLAAEREGRAFIEAAEWNEAQLSSLRKTPFQRLGTVRAFSIFGLTFQSWFDKQPSGDHAEAENSHRRILSAARSNEQ